MRRYIFHKTKIDVGCLDLLFVAEDDLYADRTVHAHFCAAAIFCLAAPSGLDRPRRKFAKVFRDVRERRMSDVVVKSIARGRFSFALVDKPAFDPPVSEFARGMISAERMRLAAVRCRREGEIGHAELALVAE